MRSGHEPVEKSYIGAAGGNPLARSGTGGHPNSYYMNIDRPGVRAAALVEQWISIVNTTVDPVLMRQYLVAYLFPGTADGKPDRARIEAALPKMPALFDLLDKALRIVVNDELGILERALPHAFNMLRPNELIWTYVVNNYMKGVEPAAFDLLAWNSDCTRIPRANHSFYTRSCYVENRLARGEMVMDGVKLDLGKVTIPIYELATKEDHIAPAQSVFRGAKLYGGDVTFVLGGEMFAVGILNVKEIIEYGALTEIPMMPSFIRGVINLRGAVVPVVDLGVKFGMEERPVTKTSCIVIVETVFVHESGETFSGGKLHVPASKQDPQGYGSALTYARRYSLMAACGIAPEDDDGNMASRSKTTVDSNVMADHLIAIQDAKTADELKKAYTDAYKACGTDANWQKKIIAAKDEKKASLA